MVSRYAAHVDPVQWARPQPDSPPWPIVGLAEIAERLGVARGTVDKWRQRDVLPPPTWELAAGPVWLWQVIERWARTTGRL